MDFEVGDIIKLTSLHSKKQYTKIHIINVDGHNHKIWGHFVSSLEEAKNIKYLKNEKSQSAGGRLKFLYHVHKRDNVEIIKDFIIPISKEDSMELLEIE